MNSSEIALILALAGLAAGPVLAWALQRGEHLRAALDGFVLVMTAGLSLVFLLPHAYEDIGLRALALAIIGFIVPRVAERTLRQPGSESSRWVLLLAVAGLLFHCAVDGAALSFRTEGSAVGDAVEHHASGYLEVTLAVVLHRLPVGLVLWSVVSPIAGRHLAWASLVALMAATVAGFYLGPLALASGHGHIAGAGVVDALLAGGLLHVIFEHPPATRESARHSWAGGGALTALALFIVLPLDSHSMLVQSWNAGHHLFVEASPAILAGFLGAGLLSLVPQQTLSRWMRGKSALGSAIRGVLFGLPIPICSCGVVPLYRGLMQKGLPPAAAAAFLVATPELGIDAIAISIPLLGWEMTLVRIAAATILALFVGLAIAAISRSSESFSGDPDTGCEEAERRGIRDALRYGFGDSIDELGPWILAGIALAALLEPLLDPAWIAALPDAAEIPLFATLSAPFYVCASAATPVGAAFLAKGVRAGAVLAFLLVGPATNVTTYGAVQAFHGRGDTLRVGAVLIGATLLLGVFVNFFLAAHISVPTHDESHAPGTWSNLAAALFVALLANSVLRQGPRGFLARLGIQGHTHDHDAAGEHPHHHSHARPARTAPAQPAILDNRNNS